MMYLFKVHSIGENESIYNEGIHPRERILAIVPDIDKKESDKQLPREIDSLPDVIKIAIKDLPIEIINKLLSISEKPGKNGKKLEDILPKLNDEQREMLLKRWAYRLLTTCKAGNALKSDTKNKVVEFLNCIWDNRGKRGEEIKIFNNDYYKDFYKERDKITSEMKELKSRIEKQRSLMEKIKKKKRETEKQSFILRQLRKKHSEKEEELRVFDFKHSNSNMYRHEGKSVKQRHELEKKLTEALVIISEFLDPTEFAIFFTEIIDSIVFYHERRSNEKGTTFGGRKASPEYIDISKKTVKKLEDALAEWSEQNKNSIVFRTKQEIGDLKKMNVLIDYFKSLLDSYQTDPKNRIYELIQMENIINILKKIAS